MQRLRNNLCIFKTIDNKLSQEMSGFQHLLFQSLQYPIFNDKITTYEQKIKPFGNIWLENRVEFSFL